VSNKKNNANRRPLSVSLSQRSYLPKKSRSVGYIWTWRRNGVRRRPILPAIGDDAEVSVLLEFRRRIAGEDAARGGLLLACRNAPTA
jgi:hypothetical protein